jgi:hypothetical protein
MNVTTTDQGVHINEAPLTTKITRENAPGLLRNAIDERIVKIRPMATPIDQLSRCAGARSCNAMKVDYYAVDVKPTSATLTKSVRQSDEKFDSDGAAYFSLVTNQNTIFSPSETLLIPTYTVNGLSEPMVLYVTKVTSEKVDVIWVNAPANEQANPTFDSIPTGAEIVRMGRAATELDVQTAQFEALPKKKTNNCQIFKMQVEQSTFQKLAAKEVGWNFSDQEEVAIIDMRQGMEKNFLFGSKAVINDPDKKEDVYLTGGIWNQTTKTFNYKKDTLEANDLINLCRQAFTGTGGGNRKILIGGSGLIEALSKIKYDKTLDAGTTFTKWGIEFKEIRSNFGSLYVLHSEIFDQCGHADDGFVLDPDYMTKYCHVPFHTETLNLRSSGQRNTDAIVITEASCLVLRHPDSHMRIIGNSDTDTTDNEE